MSSAAAATMTSCAAGDSAGVALRYALHPILIWRVGGEPASAMARLTDRSSAAALDQLDRFEDGARAAAPAVCAALESLIPSTDDRKERGDLLALKRDLHGLRPPRPNAVAMASARLEAHARDALQALVGMLCDRASLEADFPRIVDAEIRDAERRLATEFRRDNVRDGLRAVNPDLFDKLSAHFARPRTGTARKAERHLDNAFVQYLSRAALKTSPLSSFTPVLIGRWTPGGPASLVIDLPALPLRRIFSLRRSLLLDVLTPLIRNRAPLSEQDPLRLNLSIRSTDGQVVVNRIVAEPSLKAMTWGVGLEEIRLHPVPALAMVLDIFRRAGDAGLSLAALGDLVGQVQPALVKAVGELVRLGVLQPVATFHEQDDSIATALARLSGDSANGREVKLLRALEANRAAMEGEADAARRSSLTESIGRDLRDLAALAGVTLSDGIVKPFLYEDCLVAAEAPMSEVAAAPFLADLRRILALSPLFDMNAGLQSWLAESFVEQFGADGVCHDPRAFLLGQMERIDGVIAPWTMGKATAGTADGRLLKKLRDEFYDHIVGRIDGEEHCAIDPNFVDGLIARIPEKVARRPKSHSFFGQIATLDDGSRAFVLNQILSGQSQLFARFLHGDHAPSTALCDYLRDTARTGRVVELSGTYGFNANLHLKVSDETLTVAPYPGNWQGERRIELDRCTLRHDADLGRLYLVDPQGKPFDLYYLGLLNPGLMPQVQRILCGLSMQAPIFFSELSAAMRRAGLLKGGTAFGTPRVMLGAVVMQRRTRNVAHTGLPDIGKLDPAQTLIQLHRWRKEQQVPLSGFVRFAPSQQQLSVAGTDEADMDWSTFDRTKLKPFYVNFADPLLIRQFVKSLTATRFDLVVQEPLPDIGDQALTVAGAGHVAELQIEIAATARD